MGESRGCHGHSQATRRPVFTLAELAASAYVCPHMVSAKYTLEHHEGSPTPPTYACCVQVVSRYVVKNKGDGQSVNRQKQALSGTRGPA